MIWRDWKYATRSLLRKPGFTAATVATLGLAIGMATSVFSVVNAVLLRPLPYAQADRLALLWSAGRDGNNRGPISFADFEDWRRDSRTIESAAVYTAYYKPILTGVGQPERLSALLVSHQYFTVLQAKPLLGRFFLPEEDLDKHDTEVVLSHGLWRDRFNSDPRVVGRTILLGGTPFSVVGVAGPDMPLLPSSLAEEPAQIYRPVGEEAGEKSRDSRHLDTIVRLRPGVSIEQAQAELNVRCRDMERAHPKADARLGVRIVKLRDDLTRNVRAGLLGLQGAVLVVMLIACANIANLLLARSSSRRREMAVRSALGAGRGQLARMLVAESLLLAALGGAIGLVLASWSTELLSRYAVRTLPDAGDITIDPQVLIFTVVCSLAAGLLFGMAPVLRLGGVRLDDALKTGVRAAGDQRHGLRQLLAAGQIALALVLLISAGLLTRSFLRLTGVNPGFAPQGVLTASVALPSARYPTETSAVLFFDRLLTRLRTLPGVTKASMVSVVPLSANFDRTSIVLAGKVVGIGADDHQNPDRYIVDPDYFSTMQIPLRQGRLLDRRDDQSRPPVAVISETAARLWWPNESPLGKKVRAGSPTSFDNSPFREVVGVVADVAQYGLGQPATPQIYMPQAQFANRYMTLILRTDRDPELLSETVRKAVLAVDPEQPVYDVKPLESIVANTIAARRLGLWLLGVFAFGALALASVGIYGVVSYSVAQRTSEFGIRMALGARPLDILHQAIRTSLPMIAWGVAAGVGGSFAASRLLARFLYGVSATDAYTFALLPLFLASIALLASYVPARRALRVDPLTALRYE